MAALRCTGLLDTPPSEAYDRITELAADVLDVPIMLVSLVDEFRQWFKSRVGLDATETPRDISFCAHAVFDREILNVPDTFRDSRFAGNPLVTQAPFIRAYLGAPLFSREGHALGTLCAIDLRPRVFDAGDVKALSRFAKILEDAIRAEELAATTEVELRMSNEREKLFRDTFEQAGVGIVHMDPGGQLLRVNQRTCDMLGFSRAELAAKSFVEITHPDDLAQNVDLFRKMIGGEIDNYRFEKRLIRRDLSFLWCHLSVALMRTAAGAPDYVITVIEDIAARKQAENALFESRTSLQMEVAQQTESLLTKNIELHAHIRQVLDSERSLRQIEHRLRAITDNVPAIIGYWSRELRCEFANSAHQALFGRTSQDIVGMSMLELLGEEAFDTVAPHVRRVLAGQTQRFERLHVHVDGSESFIDTRYIPDLDESVKVKGFFILATDVTEARKARLAMEATNCKLAKEIATDYLTGIANRRVFSERSEEATRRFRTAGEVYGLIVLDLDNFKQINDAYGHHIGDEVLRRVGMLLKSQLRSHRDVAARLGGEEFAIMCFGDLDPELLQLIAERVRQQISVESVQTERGILRFTSSFGVAICNSEDTGWKDIYARADVALYRAKAAGKNQVSFGGSSSPGATGRFRELRVVPAR